MSVRAAVFASGGGSNLQSLLDHEVPDGPYRIELVISDREGAGALERGRNAGREVLVIPVMGRTKEEVEMETLEVLSAHSIEVIFLAGYLRLIPEGVVRGYRRRMLNIHPALLPSFGGKGMWGHHVHEAVLASGAKMSGPTIHYVDEEYDRGTIFAQWPVPVMADDDPDELAARVLRIEHILYPLAADHLCRAVGAGEEPGPFAVPGAAFAAAGEFSVEETADLIERAFEG
jgi:formyltetrahydrofolate-dependent phosphoribosylglycinamide formyltransferase